MKLRSERLFNREEYLNPRGVFKSIYEKIAQSASLGGVLKL